MKRGLIYIVTVVACSTLLSLLFFHVFNITYGANKTSDTYVNRQMHYICDSTAYNDMIFIGPSKYMMGINPYVIDSITGLKSFNASLDGAFLENMYMVFIKYLQSHPRPRFLFLGTDFREISYHSAIYNYPDFYPYLDDPFIYNTLSKYSYKFKYKWAIEFNKLRKSSSESDDKKLRVLGNIFSGKKITPEYYPYDFQYYRGFRPWTGTIEEIKQPPFNMTFDMESFKLLQQIIDTCKKDSIQLIIPLIPEYTAFRKIVRNGEEMNAKITDFAKSNNVQVWNYLNSPMCDSTDYFWNVEHLNGPGANVFSSILAKDIKKKLLTP